MPRSGQEARRRLQQAALELFVEQGFDAATTAEIAARAGVTERTYFRHFADKREVLFEGEKILGPLLADGVRAAPPDAGPLEVLRFSLLSVAPRLEANRAFAEPRQRVIDATPALKERELAKTESLMATLASGLVERGTDPRLARLAAHAALSALSEAFRSWLDDPRRPLALYLSDVFADLGRL